MKISHIICMAVLILATACTEDLQKVGPVIGKDLSVDCLNRTLGPTIVGTQMEFVFAMALPRAKGKIVSAKVEASIAGAEGTFMEHRSAHTSAAGQDVFITIGEPAVTSGGKTDVTFNRDTCAAALRYYYKIPAEARGKEVTFNFSSTCSTGETLTYKMGPYKIRDMYMQRNLTVTAENCYISIADMAVYDATQAASNASKIDLVYLYRVMNQMEGTTSINVFAHAFVSPACDAQWRPGITIPSGVNNNTPIRRVYGLRDRHLADLQYGVYVDDIDLRQNDLTNMPNYALRVLNEYGIWVKTQDGQYSAYIYVNSVNNTAGSAVISMKMLKVK